MRTWTLLLPLLALSPLAAQATGNPASAACSTAQYHALDFWLGDWDVHEDAGKGPVDAHNRVTAVLGGCALHVEYRQDDGLMGEGYSAYDASRKLWHQTFITNRGGLLVLEGGFQGKTLTLEGDKLDKDGKPERIKEVRASQGAGARETGYVSHDGGKTWVLLFDILYLPHAGS